jgi:hypothetical protein
MQSVDLPQLSADPNAGFEQAPPGVQKARIPAAIDLGSVRERKFGAAPDDDTAFQINRKVLLLFELVNKPMRGKDGNHYVYRAVNYVFGANSTLRGIAEAARGGIPYPIDAFFNLADLIGKPVQVKIATRVSKTSGKSYSVVEDVIAPGDGEEATFKPAKLPLLAWTIAKGSLTDLDKYPKYLGEPLSVVVQRSPEWQWRVKAQSGGNGPSTPAPSPSTPAPSPSTPAAVSTPAPDHVASSVAGQDTSEDDIPF